MAPWSRILRGAETPGGTQGKPSQILSRIDDTSTAGRGAEVGARGNRSPAAAQSAGDSSYFYRQNDDVGTAHLSPYS